MRALLAYLLSIAIFIGGGYVGLVWLTNPPTESTSQSASSHQSASSQPKKSGGATKETKLRAPDTAAGTSKGAVKPLEDEPVGATSNEAQVTDRNVALEVSGGKGGAEAGPADTGTAAIEQRVSKQSKVPDSPSAQTPMAKTDSVPAEGCMAIGVTARGQLVFPMQCREVLEHERGLTTEIRPSTETPAQTQTGSLAPTAPPLHETATQTEPAKPLAGMNQNLPPSTSAPIENSNIRPGTVSKAETKPVPAKAEPEPQAIKENRVVSPKVRQASRSKPVMMILRTIEFPDGHREERLLPMNRSPKTASRSDESWFSPLSYR